MAAFTKPQVSVEAGHAHDPRAFRHLVSWSLFYVRHRPVAGNNRGGDGVLPPHRIDLSFNLMLLAGLFACVPGHPRQTAVFHYRWSLPLARPGERATAR
jgi:hypothetical protein